MPTIQGKTVLGDNNRNFPLVITAPLDGNGEYKVLLEIDHECNIRIPGTREELCAILKHPDNVYRLRLLKPVITMAVEILRLREITTSERTPR